MYDDRDSPWQLVLVSTHGDAVMKFNGTGADSSGPCHPAREWREEVQKHQAIKSTSNSVYKDQVAAESSLVGFTFRGRRVCRWGDGRPRLIDYQEAGTRIFWGSGWGGGLRYS